MALAEGWTTTPAGAMARATAEIRGSCPRSVARRLRATDGGLFGRPVPLCVALCQRRSCADALSPLVGRRGGRAVVSEPLEQDELTG